MEGMRRKSKSRSRLLSRPLSAAARAVVVSIIKSSLSIKLVGQKSVPCHLSLWAIVVQMVGCSTALRGFRAARCNGHKRGLGHMGCHASGHRFFICRAEGEPEALGCLTDSGAHKVILTLLTIDSYP